MIGVHSVCAPLLKQWRLIADTGTKAAWHMWAGIKQSWMCPSLDPSLGTVQVSLIAYLDHICTGSTVVLSVHY